MSETPSPQNPNAGRTAADRGRPEEYPPDPPSEAPGDREPEEAIDEGNAGQVTSVPRGDLP